MGVGKEELTLQSLPAWQPSGTTIAFVGDEAAAQAAVYQAAFEQIATLRPELVSWTTVVIQTRADDLKDVLQLLYQKSILGVIFTAPLKSAALLAVGVGSADAIGERVGAINMVLWRSAGYRGISTDGAMVKWALDDTWRTEFKGRKVVVMGAGALARAVAVEALANGCRELWIGNRTQEHVWDAIDQILASPFMRARTHSFNLLKPLPKVPRNVLIINALPLGVRNADTTVLDMAFFDDTSLYLDTTTVPTQLYEKALQLKMSAAYGQRMRAWQIQHQVETLTGVMPDFEMILAAIAWQGQM